MMLTVLHQYHSVPSKLSAVSDYNYILSKTLERIYTTMHTSFLKRLRPQTNLGQSSNSQYCQTSLPTVPILYSTSFPFTRHIITFQTHESLKISSGLTFFHQTRFKRISFPNCKTAFIFYNSLNKNNQIPKNVPKSNLSLLTHQFLQ